MRVDGKSRPGAGKAGKKPYKAPRIISRESLESVAAVCSGPDAKTQTTLPPCGQQGGQIKS